MKCSFSYSFSSCKLSTRLPVVKFRLKRAGRKERKQIYASRIKIMKKESSKCNRIGENIKHALRYDREFLHSIQYKIENREVKLCQFLSGARVRNRKETDTRDTILSEIRKSMTQ